MRLIFFDKVVWNLSLIMKHSIISIGTSVLQYYYWLAQNNCTPGDNSMSRGAGVHTQDSRLNGNLQRKYTSR